VKNAVKVCIFGGVCKSYGLIQYCIGRVNMLPDIVLLEIFDFYRADPAVHIKVPHGPLPSLPWKWKILTQVCGRWRDVILGSPQRLDLRVVCTESTPTRTSLDIWPPLPINLICSHQVNEQSIENVIVALERHDRITQIHIDDINGSALENLGVAMHEPLPVLTDFDLGSTDGLVPVLPEAFLGGSAPLLRFFFSSGIPFPTFPKFLLSATHIVYLGLLDIPHSGYIPPEVMATSLATLLNLESLYIGFQSLPSRPLPTSLPPPTRMILPALTHLHLGGVSEYFEDLVDRIDTPQLNQLTVIFLMGLVFDDIPRLLNFIGYTVRLKPFNRASMEFSNQEISMILRSPTKFELEIVRETPDWRLSSMTQIFSLHLPVLSHVELLKIRDDPAVDFRWDYDSDMDPSQWLELFHLLIALQSLHVSKRLVPPIASTLQGFTRARAMDVLPALRSLSLEGHGCYEKP
jgi:hypothetical protein